MDLTVLETMEKQILSGDASEELKRLCALTRSMVAEVERARAAPQSAPPPVQTVPIEPVILKKDEPVKGKVVFPSDSESRKEDRDWINKLNRQPAQPELKVTQGPMIGCGPFRFRRERRAGGTILHAIEE